MDNQELRACYYDWMCHVALKRGQAIDAYSNLLKMLDEFEYTYCVDMDSNRYVDGLDLKKTFCWKIGVDISNASLLGDRCSVLEMMVALAYKCEVSIMSDPFFGDRTSVWFMSMLKSMKLDNQTNSYFDRNYVEERLNIMLNRLYDERGEGAIFEVRNPVYDMRTAEVWAQMNWFLSENY